MGWFRRAGLVALAWLGVCTAWPPAPGVAQAGKAKDKGGERQKADRPRRTDEEKAALREKRARKAETRALFADVAPIDFTLIADFDALARDRDTLSTKRFPGTLVVGDSAGNERRIPVQLRTRGHFRLAARNCRFVPIRIEFPDSGRKGTPFAAQRTLKLGTHCQRDSRYDTYTRKEYLAYRLHGVLTNHAFRARLATGTYVDAASGKTLDTRTALFIENEDELAQRLGGKIRELRGALFADFAPEPLLGITIFEYFIGNTDWSIYALHNIRLAVLPDGSHIPLAYDFDHSGLVNAHYATVDPRIGIRNVRERIHRGPCRPLTEVRAVTQHILSKRDALLAEVDSVPALPNSDRAQVRDFLEDAFRTFRNEGQTRRELAEVCQDKPGV